VTKGDIAVKKVRFLIEYGCFPLWPAEESTGFFYGPGAPVEVKARPELMSDLEQIEDIWNSLFIDNEIEFRWKGFDSEDDKQAFVMLVRETVRKLHEALDGKYIILDDSSHALNGL
jgi:hypothetical protein